MAVAGFAGGGGYPDTPANRKPPPRLARWGRVLVLFCWVFRVFPIYALRHSVLGVTKHLQAGLVFQLSCLGFSAIIARATIGAVVPQCDQVSPLAIHPDDWVRLIIILAFGHLGFGL